MSPNVKTKDGIMQCLWYRLEGKEMKAKLREGKGRSAKPA